MQGRSNGQFADDYSLGREQFFKENRPKNSWTFTGSKGLEVCQSFDADQMDFTWLYAYPEDLGQLDVELWAKRTVLAPGESLTMRQTIEVRPAK